MPKRKIAAKAESKAEFWSTEEFKSLNKQWQKKLSESGFEDIEQDEAHLKRALSPRYAQAQYKESAKSPLAHFKEAYYRLAGQFLYDHKFSDEVERYIWDRHAQGDSIREIVTKLKSGKMNYSRVKVHQVITDLASIMKEKNRTSADEY